MGEIMRRCFHLFLILAVLKAMNCSAGGLGKVWEFDLQELTPVEQGHRQASIPVFALRFSPDGQHVAVIMDWLELGGGGKSYVLVLQTLHPELAARKFEFAGQLNENEEDDIAPFGWSPSGEILQVGGTLIRFADGNSCSSLSYYSRLIGDNRAIARDPAYAGPVNRSKDISHFLLFSSECHQVDKWEIPEEEWSIRDVSAERGLLSVRCPIELGSTQQSLIVDVNSRKVLHRWHGNAPSGYFADSGKAICDGNDVDSSDRAPVTCWDVDTGAKIAEAPTINGGYPFRAALHASRIVASDYRRRKIPFNYEYTSVLKRRVVWDFRTNKEIASWTPDVQSYMSRLLSRPKQIKEPFRFAISPDGHYVVEGGNGSLRLYKIEP